MSKINLRNDSLLKFLPAVSLILSSGGCGKEGGKKLFCRMFGVITGNPVAGTPSGEEEYRPTINSCLKFSSKKLMSPYVIRGSAEPDTRFLSPFGGGFLAKTSGHETKLINHDCVIILGNFLQVWKLSCSFDSWCTATCRCSTIHSNVFLSFFFFFSLNISLNFF